MFSSRWRFGLDRYSEVNLFTDRYEANEETLSQAIRAAASEEPDVDGSVLFGHLKGTVVGLRYYTGMVNQGEMVGLVREPENPYDRNAVMVANIYGNQVGHIKRELAAAMAHVMDKNLAKVEGVVPSGTKNTFTMPVMLSFWGKEENKKAVIEGMAHRGFKLNTSGSSATGTYQKSSNSQGACAMSSKKGLTIPLTAEELKNAFDNLFDGLMESKDGEKEAAEAVGTPLLLHQKQALSWMCARENKSALPPFWEKRGELYYNSLTCFSAKEIPERIRGGILADDMGLGKTLTTLALILTNFHNGKPLPVEKCEEHSSPIKSKSKPQEGSSAGNRAEVSHAAAGPQGSDLPQVEVICVNTTDVLEKVDSADVVEIVDKSDNSTSKGKKKANKRKPSKEAPVMLEDLDFAAALGGSAADTSIKKKKKSGKKAGPTQSVESSVIESPDELSARTTLIICPLSVISNWLHQLDQHVRANVKLNVYLYYGSERNRSKAFLSSQDVVITTYNVLSADSGNKSPLHSINWLRVVLDEGHVVRNPNAQMSKAVLGLKAQRRWILSGTPIQNSVKDLWMLLAFLRLKPFDVREWWNRVIQRPVTGGDRAGLQNLQNLVKCITLRRTKSSEVNGRPLVSLPEKAVCVEQVELSQTEREEYELARNEGKNTISKYVAEGTVLRNYADVLAILMRLRQHCCHPDLLAKTSSDLGAAATPGELRERLIDKLRLVLASGSDEECSVCLESMHLPVITHCAHVYCRPCIAQVINTEQEAARCPLCRSEIKANELVEFPQEEMEEEKSTNSDKWRTSSKVQALMGNLLRLRCEDSSIKYLVVSQFTRFLSILETPLREHGFSFVRLDGTMSQKKRTQVIQEFQSSAADSPAIMLLSLKAGGVGLNLTAASHVFLMDPAWNPATEEQCIDRCHRLGQTRKVIVTKFIVKDSVEENMVKIQRQKQDLVEKAFGSSNTERKTSRIDDIKALMEL
ncbi:helicase-like transcription factor [Etheostoma cragini]|uniref:helicase-like transcription factor n=1 Tax=Etheostoma cragini TaxID=417921 RepID=UPI00155F00A8|nr:helicase-like transcription factor [Etheostoma cragini]XP_034714306.1 helicase-like transcription factor [Etheostoma cragini]XP_034714307.1 helicase-like transcription factor [Etheostoma cragini]XP_034714308.1 helicase-like transcription factor [Etheostoma cragini]XP_034714310.1 helicase-like transcription factor [Etheostoma cragini]